MDELKDAVCESCGNGFEENDDVVYCPECGAPVHRQCWEKAGECPFSARHAEGFSWQPAISDEAAGASGGMQGEAEMPVYHDEEAGQSFVRIDISASHKDERDFNEKKYMGVSEKEMMCFLNVSDTHQLYRYTQMKHMAQSGKKLSFNLFAGWLNPYNQFYKGMLPLGMLLLALRFIIALPEIVVYYFYMFLPDSAESLISNSSLLSAMTFMNYLQLAIMLLLCLFGDYLYLLHMVKKIKQIRLNYGDGTSEEYFTALVEAGKNRWGRVFICAGIMIALILAAMLVLAACSS